jgi:YhcH/YjgK/YiaL family protein
MIFEILNNFNNYVLLSSHFKDIAQFLARKDLERLEIGKHTISDRGAFALVSEYATKPESECYIECHKKHIDIQMVVSGKESIGFCQKSDCKESPYDPEKDFQKLSGELNFVTMKPGNFAVFFPDDGHMPGLRVGSFPEHVKKIVIKVPVL